MSKFLIDTKAAAAALAKWAIRQSPYGWPEGLEICVRHIEGQREGFDEFRGMWFREFSDWRGVEGWYKSTLSDNQETASLMEDWNTRRNGRDGHQFISRHASAIDPDDDFIDLDALFRNAARDLLEEHERSEAFDRKWEAEQGVTVTEALRAEFET